MRVELSFAAIIIKFYYDTNITKKGEKRNGGGGFLGKDQEIESLRVEWLSLRAAERTCTTISGSGVTVWKIMMHAVSSSIV